MPPEMAVVPPLSLNVPPMFTLVNESVLVLAVQLGKPVNESELVLVYVPAFEPAPVHVAAAPATPVSVPVPLPFAAVMLLKPPLAAPALVVPLKPVVPPTPVSV